MKAKPSKSEAATGRREKRIRLPKVLGIWDTSSFIISSTIGSGIFISPKEVLRYTVSPGMALVMWLATGLVNLVLSFFYAELSLTFPKAGSDYTYMNEGIHELASFLFIWVTFVFKSECGRAIQALTFSTYFCKLFFGSCPSPESAKRLVAALAVSAIVAIQCYSSRWSVKISGFLTITKLLGLTTIMISGLVHLGSGGNENLGDLMANSSGNPLVYGQAFYAAFWAYSGLNDCTNVIEELKEPLVKNVVVSLVISQLTIMFVYLLTNFAYVVVLSRKEILDSDVVAMSFGEKVFSGLYWLMPFIVAASALGGLSSAVMESSRLFLAGTRRRHLPRPLALLNAKFLTPIPIYIVYLAICLALLVSGSSIGDLMSYATYIETLGVTGSVVSLISLRLRRPDLRRPLRNPILLPMLFCCVLLLLLLVPIYQTPRNTGICFGFIATGIPVYFLLIFPDRKFGWLLRLEQRATRLVQKLTYSLPEDEAEECGETGGKVDLAFDTKRKT